MIEHAFDKGVPGFADPVHDAQRVFRACLAASSRPGTVIEVRVNGGRLPGCGSATAALLLALTDETTAVWWSEPSAGAAEALRFHGGAPAAASAADAMFAVCTRASSMPSLNRFNAGADDAPERSCTVLIEVDSFDSGPPLEWRGPGIANAHMVAIAGVPPAFWSQWQANHAAFPRGVDVVFTCGKLLMGLPRTTRVSRLAAIATANGA